MMKNDEDDDEYDGQHATEDDNAHTQKKKNRTNARSFV